MGVGVVLMLAERDDGEAASVSQALAVRGVRVEWLDTAWFPAQADVTARLASDGWRGEITTEDGTVRLEEITRGVLPAAPPVPLPRAPQRAGTTIRHRRSALRLRRGVHVPSGSMVSHPARVAGAEYRLLQMATAARCGFTLLASIVTNRPGDAREFAASAGDAVYKATMHKLIGADDELKLIYTTPVAPAAIDDRVATTLHLFQSNVPKTHDVRAAVTGAGHVHAVAIRTDDPAARQDFRAGHDMLTYEITSMPAEVAHSCHAYLKALGLELGVFDFAVTDDGAWWFLECGPGAQWAWLEAETGTPIADAIADTLTGAPV